MPQRLTFGHPGVSPGELSSPWPLSARPEANVQLTRRVLFESIGALPYLFLFSCFFMRSRLHDLHWSNLGQLSKHVPFPNQELCQFSRPHVTPLTVSSVFFFKLEDVILHLKDVESVRPVPLFLFFMGSLSSSRPQR